MSEELSNIEKLVNALRRKLLAKPPSKAVEAKLADPEKLAEQFVREIGSDTQRISLK